MANVTTIFRGVQYRSYAKARLVWMGDVARWLKECPLWEPIRFWFLVALIMLAIVAANHPWR